MMKRFLAILMALTMILAALPGTALAASGKVTGNRASVAITEDGVVMNIKWKKVSGAEGYEYAYNLFYSAKDKKSDWTFKTTDQTGATIRLKDYGTIDIRVRAYKTVRGKKVYGQWTTGRLKRGQVDKMVVKQLKKLMKKKDLFLRANAKNVNLRKNAGGQYEILAKMNKYDEARATGNFKRDDNGNWWSEVVYGTSQTIVVTGWVARLSTDPVWY